MKDDNLSFKVYNGFNNISNDMIIKIKNNYEDCFTGQFVASSKHYIFLLIQDEDLIGSAEYDQDKHLIWNYCINPKNRGKKCSPKSKCSQYLINQMIKFITQELKHNNIYLFTDRKLNHRNSPDDMIRREKFYEKAGFKLLYVPTNENTYNFSGEKIIDKLNKEEKSLRKYNGNYFCVWKYETHTNKSLQVHNGSSNFLTGGIFLAGLFLLNNKEFILSGNH